MENASKALLIAGGILISIIIITILVKTFGSIKSAQGVQLSEEEQKQVIVFNEPYTKYLGQYVYGTEVITIVNKSVNDGGEVTVHVIFAEDYTYTVPVYKNGEKTTKTITIKSGKNIDLTKFIEEQDIQTLSITEEETMISGLKSKAFLCTNIEYSSTTGKVQRISFEEKKWGNLN